MQVLIGKPQKERFLGTEHRKVKPSAGRIPLEAVGTRIHVRLDGKELRILADRLHVAFERAALERNAVGGELIADLRHRDPAMLRDELKDADHHEGFIERGSGVNFCGHGFGSRISIMCFSFAEDSSVLRLPVGSRKRKTPGLRS